MRLTRSRPVDLRFASFTVYSSRKRGEGAIEEKSREVCIGIKTDRGNYVERGVAALNGCIEAEGLRREFLGENSTLVPVPRSKPLKRGALWPSARICDELLAAGLGKEKRECLARERAVTKSAIAQRGERPSVPLHIESMSCGGGDLLVEEITLVDDVVTQGRTLVACAEILRGHFPNAMIRAFAFCRVLASWERCERIVDPCVGTIYFDGKDTRRRP